MKQARRRGLPQRIKVGLIQYLNRRGLKLDEIADISGFRSAEIQEALTKPNVLIPQLEDAELKRRAKGILARLGII